MSPSKRYAKKHAKARQRRRLQVHERLERDRRQAQRAAEGLHQALEDLGLPANLVVEIEGRLRSQQKLLGKMIGVMFPALFGCRTCAPQKLICDVPDCLIQPKLWLTHQEPITVGDDTRGGCEDRVDVPSADGAYQSKAMDGGIGIHLLNTWRYTDKRGPTGDHIVHKRDPVGTRT